MRRRASGRDRPGDRRLWARACTRGGLDALFRIDGDDGRPELVRNDFHNGDFEANATPQNETIAFADEGSFGDVCQVRMRRIGPWLLVEDNEGCGAAGVTFVGLYRRKN